MRELFTIVAAILAMLGFVAGARAEKRIALVIGNSAYQHTPELKNPRNDAADMASALRRLKFDVFEGLDLDKRAMEGTIRKFALALRSADVALFFYAGHGLQVSGQNYLVPIDARLEEATALDFEMIRLDLVHRAMERETKANLIFLDACRDNPLSRNLARALGTRSSSIGRGLAPTESGEGTLISFSTQPGNVALDGTGRNSPFTTALLKRISSEGEDLSSILIAVRNDVMEATRNRQVPWEHSALRSKFFFSAPVSSAPLARADNQAEIELAYWNAAQAGGSAASFKSYLERYPHGAYAGSAKLMLDKLQREDEARAKVAAREAELRAKEAEERRKAEDAKRAAELAGAREEVRKAQEAARMAEAERLAAVKAAEEARKQPGSAKAPQQAVQVASLPPVAEPKKVDGSVADTGPLARSLKAELKRVGCDPGTVDGVWGTQAREALAKFARLAKVSLSVDTPTAAALDALTGQKGRVCPLSCTPSEIQVNGKCIARPKVEQASRNSAPKPESEKPSGSGLCFASGGGFTQSAFVPCDHPTARGKAF
jgi:uncharacterized caspase-like protein